MAAVTCRGCGRANAADARFCDRCGAPLGVAAPTSRRTVSVLFCDLVGSTALGEALDPEALRTLLASYHARVRAAAERHGGLVEKFIGDAVVAVFGLPQLHEDDALRAVRAAAGMRAEVADLSARLETERGVGLACRIGVNTGEVVVGEGEALVTGDAVNVAARLEQAAATGEILLGVGTEELVRGAAEVAAPRRLELRGKSEAVRAFPLLRVAPPAGRVPRSALTPLVGRAGELELLRALYARAVRLRVPHTATVLGPAGIGKSRLVQAFLDGVPEAGVLAGRCLPYGVGITYWPLREALASRLGADPVAAVRRLAGDDPDAGRIAGGVAAALGAAPPAGGDEIPWAVRRVVELLGAERPVVLVLDDAHRAEDALLAVLEHVRRFARELRLLLLYVGRPELADVAPAWAPAASNGATIVLEPLSHDECRALVDGEAERGVQPEQRERIVAAAGGNPLFAEQLLAAATDDPAAGVLMPPTVRALLAARIDRLPPALHELLERAAVEGSTFHVGALGGGPEVDDVLAQLVSRGLVRPAAPGVAGEAAYAFAHVLIRDVAYDGMSKHARAAAHARCSAWLDARRAPPELAANHLELAFELLHELEPAGDATRTAATAAADALASAGSAAAARGDAGAAVSLLSRAVATGAARDPVEVLTELATELRAGGRFAEASRAIDDLAAHGGAVAAAHADVARFALDLRTRPAEDLEAGRSRVEAAATLFRSRGDHRGAARAFRAVAEYHQMLDRAESALAALRAAREEARLAGDRALEVRIALDQAPMAWLGKMPMADIPGFLDTLWDDPGDPPPAVAARLAVFRGVARAALGDVAGGRAEVAHGRDVQRELGRLGTWAVTAQAAAEVEDIGGDLQAAEAVLREGRDELARLGEWGSRSTHEALRALYLADLGRRDEAAAAIAECRRLASPDDVASRATSDQAEALLRSAAGDHAAAVALARGAVELERHADSTRDVARCHATLGRVLAAAGETEAARAELACAADLYDRKGIAVLAAAVRTRCAALPGPPGGP